MGVLPIGGSVPPNAQIAGILSTVFAITSGGNPEVGIALALPIGVLAQLMIMMAWNVNIILVHGADKYLLAGDYKKVEKTHLMGLLVFLVIFFVTTFLAVFFGSEWVNSLVTAMPDVLTDGLKVASGILPAVGMAMLLKMMNFKRYWPFFLIGFVFAAWLQLPVLAVSVAAVGIVFALNAVMAPKASSDGFDDEFEDDAEDEEANEAPRLLDMKILKKTFIRSFFFMTSINYERYESLGFCYAMIPALRVLYPDPEDFKAAMSRENEFFNCHPYTGNAVLGVASTSNSFGRAHRRKNHRSSSMRWTQSMSGWPSVPLTFSPAAAPTTSLTFTTEPLKSHPFPPWRNSTLMAGARSSMPV